MKMTEFCDHLYDESTDGYIQILKLDDKNNSGERTIKIYNTKNDGLRDIVEELHKKEDVFLAPNTMYLPKRRVENIRQFIPKPKSPVIVNTIYFVIIEITDILNNLSVLSIACIAAAKAGCIYIIKKNGPIKYI